MGDDSTNNTISTTDASRIYKGSWLLKSPAWNEAWAVRAKLLRRFSIFIPCFFPVEEKAVSPSDERSWFHLPSVITWNSFSNRNPWVPESTPSPSMRSVIRNETSCEFPSSDFTSISANETACSRHAVPMPLISSSCDGPLQDLSSQKDCAENVKAADKESVELRTLIVEATEPQSATIIWLHSLGDSGKFFANEDGHGLGLPDVLAVPWCRFIFPTATDISVTLHGGVQQPAWFDIERLDDRGIIQNEPGLLAAAQQVMNLVAKELRSGIPARRIILAGFGQVISVVSCVWRLFGSVRCGLADGFAAGERAGRGRGDAGGAAP